MGNDQLRRDGVDPVEGVEDQLLRAGPGIGRSSERDLPCLQRLHPVLLERRPGSITRESFPASDSGSSGVTTCVARTENPDRT